MGCSSTGCRSARKPTLAGVSARGSAPSSRGPWAGSEVRGRSGSVAGSGTPTQARDRLAVNGQINMEFSVNCNIAELYDKIWQ